MQDNLVVQENRYVMAMQDLQKAQAELDDKQAELDVVQAEYEQAMTEKQVTVLRHCGQPFIPFLLSFSKGLISSRDSLNWCTVHTDIHTHTYTRHMRPH